MIRPMWCMAVSMLAGCGGQVSEKPAESGAAGQTTQASGGKEDGFGSEGGKVMTCAMQKEPETLESPLTAGDFEYAWKRTAGYSLSRRMVSVLSEERRSI